MAFPLPGQTIYGAWTQAGEAAADLESRLPSKTTLPIDLKNYGWIGDNASHPLSAFYGTLAAAQADYPHATSLSQEKDWAAFQAVLNLYSNGRSGIANGEIWVRGVGLINTPLCYGGDPSKSLYLRGMAGQGVGGVGLKWNGTTGTSMVIFQSACRSTIDGVNLDGSGGSGIVNCLHISADNVVNTTLSGPIAAGNGVVATPVAMTNIAIGTLLGIDAGANYELVYVTAVTGATFTANFLRSHLTGVQVGGGSGSSGVRVKNLNMIVPGVALSAGVLVGNATSGTTMQTDLFRSEKNTFIGNGASGSAYAGIRQITGGNVKNFYSADDEFFGFKSPIAIEAGSGVYSIRNPEFLNTTVQDVLMLGTGHLLLDSAEAESATPHRFAVLGSGGGTSPVSALLQNNSWEATAPADDIIIDAQCNLTLIGNNFLNFRTGSSIPLIRNAGIIGANNPQSITSIGNYYQNADDTTPIFYQATNALKNGVYVSTHDMRLFSRNDYGGAAGTLIPLTPIDGPTSTPIAGLDNEPTDVAAGLTFRAVARQTSSVNSVTIPFAAFSAAALTKDLNIFGINARTKVVAVYADTTIAFAGPAGTLQLRIGFTVGGQEFILDHDVKSAPVTKGLADADMGASLTRAAAIQGGAFIANGWGGTGTQRIKARLTSSAGNLDTLNAGSVTVHVVVERYPL